MNNNIYKQLKNNEITELDLSNNKIENIDKLSKNLKYNNSLEVLYLNNNKIENIDRLSKSLIFNSSLKELYLNYNKTKEEDLIKLKEKYKNIRIYF